MELTGLELPEGFVKARGISKLFPLLESFSFFFFLRHFIFIGKAKLQREDETEIFHLVCSPNGYNDRGLI